MREVRAGPDLECGRARSRNPAGGKPAPEGLASHREVSPWRSGGNIGL